MTGRLTSLKRLTNAARPDSPRKYFVFVVVSLGLLVTSISGTAITVAFPSLIADLNTDLITGGWVLTAYQLMSIATVPAAGRLVETMGRKPSFMMFTAIFTVSSALCALAPNVLTLIIFRTMQSVGGAGLLPCAAGIVSDEFPQNRQKAIGLFASIFPVGMVLGPNVGAWLVEAWGWRSTFWFTAVTGLLVLALGQLILRSNTPAKDGRRPGLDLAGAGWLGAFLFAFISAITQLASVRSWTSWLVEGVLFLSSAVLLLVFIRHERRVKDPIIDLGLLREKPFLAANTYNIFFGLCAFGIFSLMPLYAMSVYGLSIIEAGLVLTPRFLAMMIFSTVTSLLLNRWGYRRPILAGTILMGISLAILALQPQGGNFFGIDISATTMLLVIMFVTGIAIGLAGPAANNACIELMPDRIPTIVGLRAMFRGIGGSMGIAVSTLILDTVGDPHQAFLIAFMAWASLMLVVLPSIFAMPGGPDAGKTKKC